jgi:hypothetical protein
MGETITVTTNRRGPRMMAIRRKNTQKGKTGTKEILKRKESRIKVFKNF